MINDLPSKLHCSWLLPDGSFEVEKEDKRNDVNGKLMEAVSHIGYVKKYIPDTVPVDDYQDDPDLNLMVGFMREKGWVRVVICNGTDDYFFHNEKPMTDAQKESIAAIEVNLRPGAKCYDSSDQLLLP